MSDSRTSMPQNGAPGTDKKAFAERAAAERNSAFNGGLGALPSTSSLWQMDSHKHCLPVVSEQKSTDTEYGA